MNVSILFDGMTLELLLKVGIFFVCGFGGMVAAYSYRWAQDKVPVSWWVYMTSDKHEVGMAMTKLLAACWVGGSFEYLTALDLNAIINAGILLGMTIPDKVDEAKAKQKQTIKDKDRTDVKPIGHIE